MSRPVEIGITRPFSYHKQEKLFSKYELSTFISGTDLDSWTALFPLPCNNFLKVNLSIIMEKVAAKQRG